MMIDNRIKMISFLENNLITKAIDTFERKNQNQMSEEERLELYNNWYRYSSSITRMWLNYMTDDHLNDIFTKKMQQEQKSDNPQLGYG